MKFSFQRIIIPFALALVLLLGFFVEAPKASAVIYKGRDHESSYEVHQNQTTLKYDFDAIYTEVRVYDVAAGFQMIYQGSGSEYHSIPFVPGRKYRITLCPFGFRSNSNGINPLTIPSEFQMKIGYGYVYNTEDTGYATIPSPSVYGYWYKYQVADPFETFTIGTLGQEGKTVITTNSYTIDRPDAISCLSFEFQWNNISWESDPIPEGIWLEDFEITAIVDNKLLLDNFYQWTQGDPVFYSELVKAVNTSEDILANYFPPRYPLTVEDFDKVEMGEDYIRDFLDENLGTVDDLANSFYSIIQSIGPSMLFFTWIFDLFTGISFFSNLLNIVISLGITAFVLNLVLSLVTRSRSENNKSSESRKR